MDVYQVGESYLNEEEIKKITSGIDEVINQNLPKERINFEVLEYILSKYKDHVNTKKINL